MHIKKSLLHTCGLMCVDGEPAGGAGASTEGAPAGATSNTGAGSTEGEGGGNTADPNTGTGTGGTPDDSFKSLEGKSEVLKDLAGERDRRQQSERDLADALAKIKEYEDAKLSDDEKRTRDLKDATARAADLETKNAELTRSVWRRDAAEQAKLPAGMADRLRGDTKDEIESDAQALAAALVELGGGAHPAGPAHDSSQGHGSHGGKPHYSSLTDAISGHYTG